MRPGLRAESARAPEVRFEILWREISGQHGGRGSCPQLRRPRPFHRCQGGGQYGSGIWTGLPKMVPGNREGMLGAFSVLRQSTKVHFCNVSVMASGVSLSIVIMRVMGL